VQAGGNAVGALGDFVVAAAAIAADDAVEEEDIVAFRFWCRVCAAR
jgi:uncharacterized protein (DUF1778 family)